MHLHTLRSDSWQGKVRGQVEKRQGHAAAEWLVAGLRESSPCWVGRAHLVSSATPK